MTAFVSPRAVPQLADAEELFALPRQRSAGPVYWTLVPNMPGLERVLAAGARAIAVFTGATDTFMQRNIGMIVQESLAALGPVVKGALGESLQVRGYISVCFGCPYEGPVEPQKVLELARRLLDPGCQELSLGDTIGVAVPTQIAEVAGPALAEAGATQGAVHFHDTRGTALANALAAWAAARWRPGLPATWRPRTCSPCCMAWASRPESRWRRCRREPLHPGCAWPPAGQQVSPGMLADGAARRCHNNEPIANEPIATKSIATNQ